MRLKVAEEKGFKEGETKMAESTFKSECKDKGFCFETDCSKETTCPFLECTRDACECASCLDSNKKCRCSKCDVFELRGECDWREECGLKDDFGEAFAKNL